VLSEISPGACATPGHPFYVDGAWRKASTLDPPRLRPCNFLYNFVLSHGHIIRINGIHSVTLGHGLEEDGLADDFWGTQRVVDELRMDRGWSEGFVERSVGAPALVDVRRQVKTLLGLPAATDGIISIDEVLLHSIHAAGVRDAVPSQFRSTQVVIYGAGHHIPPTANEVPALVARHLHRTKQLLQEGVAPFSLAAYPLWWINAVHPYEDGNGRLARGVAFWLLRSSLDWHARFK